jgi:hypothetical protein
MLIRDLRLLSALQDSKLGDQVGSRWRHILSEFSRPLAAVVLVVWWGSAVVGGSTGGMVLLLVGTR